jgi:hypothetical protein
MTNELIPQSSRSVFICCGILGEFEQGVSNMFESTHRIVLHGQRWLQEVSDICIN